MSTQIGDLLLQLDLVRLESSLQRFAVRLQRLDGGVQVVIFASSSSRWASARRTRDPLAFQRALHAVGFGGDATAQLILLRFELHQRFLGRCGPLR